jgi:hypothetical protein
MIAIAYDARRARRLLARKREEVLMDARICKYASGFVLLASLGLAGYTDDGASTDHLTGPSTLTPVPLSIVTVEPAAVRPVFLRSPSCFTASPFQAGFSLVFRAEQELLVSGFGFEFLDRFGQRSVPTLIPTSSTGSSFVPVPLPTSSPVPIPGPSSSFNGFVMTAGTSSTVPFLLQFGCGVAPSGTLIVSVNTASRGTPDVRQVSLRIVG